MPVWAKLTPSTTDIVVEARGAFLGGADAITSSNTFPSLPLIDPETLEFEMNVDGYVSSGGLGGPAILPLSLAKMAQLTQAFPDKAFSGIGGVAEFAHALNYFLLGCGTVQVCTAAMLDHAIGPNVIKQLTAGHAGRDGAARLVVARRLPRRAPRSRRHALEDPAAGRQGLSRRLRRGRLRGASDATAPKPGLTELMIAGLPGVDGVALSEAVSVLSRDHQQLSWHPAINGSPAPTRPPSPPHRNAAEMSW